MIAAATTRVLTKYYTYIFYIYIQQQASSAKGEKTFYFLKANTCRPRDVLKKNERTWCWRRCDVTRAYSSTLLYTYIYKYIHIYRVSHSVGMVGDDDVLLSYNVPGEEINTSYPLWSTTWRWLHDPYHPATPTKPSPPALHRPR